MNTTISPCVFIVDDDESVRDSVAALVSSAGYQVECFSSAEHFLMSVEVPRPGVMVLDVRMPGMSGLELLQQLQKVARFLPVIIVTAHGTVPVSVEAMRAGAVDVYEKPYDPEKMQASIEAAMAKADTLWNACAVESEVKGRLERLSAREVEVCDLLVKGIETKEIALRLEISASTVEKHRLKVFEKLEVSSVPRLIRLVAGLD